MSQNYAPSKRKLEKQPMDSAPTNNERNDSARLAARSRELPVNYRASIRDPYYEQHEADGEEEEEEGEMSWEQKRLLERMDQRAALELAASESNLINYGESIYASSMADSGVHSIGTLRGNADVLMLGPTRTLSSSPDSTAVPPRFGSGNAVASTSAAAAQQATEEQVLDGDEVEERLFMDKRNRLLKFIQTVQEMLDEWRAANRDKRIAAFPYAPPPPMMRAGRTSRNNSMSVTSGSLAVADRAVRRTRSSRPDMDGMSASLSALPGEFSSMHRSMYDMSPQRGSGALSPDRRAGRQNGRPSHERRGSLEGAGAARPPRRASDFAGSGIRMDSMTSSMPALPEAQRPPSRGALQRPRRGSGSAPGSSSDIPSAVTIHGADEQTDIGQESLKVLKLDLKLNLALGSGNVPAALEPGSIAPLLEDRLASVARHLDNLRERVRDTSFKVIVAGDVNAGKSSLVNALLRRTVVPVDQQPLTSTFLEVLDARLNDDVEEAHACEDRRIYDRADESTFWRIPLRHLEATVADWTGDEHSIIKVYARQADDDSALVHNDGVANLSVIDSPGLNTDSIKTFFLLARQEEIDVVVFVLNAENTLTLSGREFLEQASKEKAHLFFVVNRFESIRAKERCARRILEQIREVSPRTYDEADDLVHWISPTRVSLDDGHHGSDDDHSSDDDGDGDGRQPNGTAPDDWKRMERALRNFTLGRRARTKLEPAKLYLLNILTDLRLLSRLNRRDADRLLTTTTEALEATRPSYERLVASQRVDCTEAEREVETAGDDVRMLTRRRLRAVMGSFEIYGGEPAWPGFSGMMGYVDRIRSAILDAWNREVLECERSTLARVSKASEQISALGTEHLTESARTADVSRLFAKGGDAHRLSVRIDPWDLIDVRERIGLATAGIGSAAVLLGNLIGFKGLLVNAAHVGSSVNSFGGFKRWFFFTVTMAGVGAAVFIVGDMQYAVHRKVARKIRARINDAGLVDLHADRVSKRAHAALRFSAQDLRERYQRAVEKERARREQCAQDQLDARDRRRWFRDMAKRAKDLHELVNMVDCDDRKIPMA